jgi:hypothetical protein
MASGKKKKKSDVGMGGCLQLEVFFLVYAVMVDVHHL